VTTSNDVRDQLIEALRLDLIGPRTGHPPHARQAEEQLSVAPSKWYLTGFLAPHDAPLSQRADDDADDQLDGPSRKVEADDDAPPEAASADKELFPSSMGLSVLVSAETRHLRVKLAWGDYVPVRGSEAPGAPDGARPPGQPSEERAGRGRWRRVPRESDCLVTLEEGTHPSVALRDFPELLVIVSVRAVGDLVRKAGDRQLVPAGTRSVSVFLVNYRPPAPDVERDAAYLFQPELSLHAEEPFVPRPDLHGQNSDDKDEEIADLQYCDAVEYAVGHNVAAVAVKDAEGRYREVRTDWMPAADVEKVIPRNLRPDVELGMEALAAAPSAQGVRAKVGPMLTAYSAWLKTQAERAPADPGRRKVAEELLTGARRAHDRIQAGLDALDDPQVLEAFRIANGAVATAIRQRLSHDRPDLLPASHKAPSWRPFQLAFVLMNLVGAVDPTHPDRDVVDLLFFPTGGGKTEAYLGLAAFVMVLRRLRDPSVSVRGSVRAHALHAAPAHARSARPRGDADVRARARTAARREEARRLALRDRPVGRPERDAEPHGLQGRQGRTLGPRAHDRFPERLRSQALADPARELPVVRVEVHEGQLQAPARTATSRPICG
jgi:hypothetical protein